MFCQHCGTEIKTGAVICLNCGAAAPGSASVSPADASDQWLVALLLCMFLGPFGIHNFYLKKTGIGVAQLVLGLCSCFVISGIWCFVDLIMIASGNFKKADGSLLTHN